MKNLYVTKSVIHGNGLFTKENFKKDDIIGISHVLYDNIWHQVSPIGIFYNHSNNPNANWRHCELPMVFDFYSLKDIKKGEEICTYYGDIYWDFKKKREVGIKYY